MFKGVVIGIVATVIAVLLAIYLVLVMGVIPASADSGPLPLENWAAGTSLQATLSRDAPKISNPVPLTDANLVAGIQLFAKHCAICHGTARGNASPSPVARGEFPSPPQLATDGVEDDPQGWTYWKIDHGIRWTGMPSWKDTLSSRDMWTLALFLKHMDHLPPVAEQVWQKVVQPKIIAPISQLPALNTPHPSASKRPRIPSDSSRGLQSTPANQRS